MRPISQLLKGLYSFALLMLIASGASATHYMGVDVTYVCLPGGNGCTYRIFHNTYYDCAGSATQLPPNTAPAPTINFNAPGCTGLPTIIGVWTLVSYVEVTPVCPGFLTRCSSPQATVNGVLEARYYADYNFCNLNCNNINITWSNCCRNGSITSGAANDGIYSGGTQVNLGLSPCNSSPNFANPPVPYICAGQAFTFNQGAIDPDGDSLAYVLVPCQDGATTQVGYNAGYSPTQPLGASWNVSINATTGDITVAPNPGSLVTGVLCVTVEEWRNGVKIGEVTRDIQMTVITCGNNTPPTITGISNISGGTATGPYKITVCNNDSVCFNIGTSDVDTNDSLTLVWNELLKPAGAMFFDPANPGVTDTIPGTGANPPTGRFCWRVPSGAGNYQFLVQIQDNGCPILGTNQVTVEIEVISCRLAPTITTKRVGCYDVEFTICPGGGIAPYNYVVTGTGGLNLTTSAQRCLTFTHSYPATNNPVTYNYNAVISDASGLVANDNGAVTLSNTAIADAGRDIALCPNVSGQIGTPGLAGYSYSWQGINGTNLGLPSGAGRLVAQPFVSLNNTTSGSLNLCYEVTATDSVGCVRYDTVCVTYNPKPRPTFSATPQVCQNEIATLSYTGANVPGSSYFWDFQNGRDASGDTSATGIGPHLISWAPPLSGPQTVSLFTVVNGCTSDVVSSLVVVNPIPSTNFRVISPICEGQASIITYTGNSSPAGIANWSLDGATVLSGNINGLDPLTLTWNSPGPKVITLDVEDKGCFSTVTSVDTVVVNQVPTSTFSNPGPTCINDSVRLVYTGNADPASTYTWTFDGGQANPPSAGPGPYNVSWATAGLKRVCLSVQEKGCFSTQTCQNIQVYDKPTPRIDPVADVCFNNGNNTVNFLYTGTPGVATYNWDLGASAAPPTSNVPNPTGVQYLTTGTKTVSLTVANNGCVSDPVSINFDVIEEPKADFIINSNGVTCANDSVAFSITNPAVGPGQTYLWNFGQDANPATSSLADPGKVLYTSGGTKTISLLVTYRGCTHVYASQLQVEESPQFSAGLDKEFCEGAGGSQINATTLGGSPAYTWSWWCDATGGCGLSSPNVEDPFVNPNPFLTAPDTVTYFGQATDARGCKSNIDMMDVVIHPKPKVDAGRDTIICELGFGATLQGGLHVNNLAPGPFSWQWTDDNNNIPPDGMVAPNDKQPVAYTRPVKTTIYTLVVSDLSTGCTSEVNTVDTFSTVTVTVNPNPVVDAGRDTVMCFKDFIQLNGSASGGNGNYAYTWTPTNTGSIITPDRRDPIISPTQTTTYTLTVNSDGCETADQVTVTVHTKPTADAGDPKVICFGDSVQLDGRASGAPQGGTAYSYLWTPAQGLSDPSVEKPMASPAITRDYKFIATSEYGCGSDTSTTSVTVEATPLAQITSSDTVICAGDEISLNATHGWAGVPGSPNVVYEWSPADDITSGVFGTSITVAPRATTVFTLRTTEGRCFTEDIVQVSVVPGVEAGIEIVDSVICDGEATLLIASGGRGNANYSWSPGLSLDDSTAQQALASPSTTTLYTLTVQEGVCSDDTTIELTVFPTPTSDYFASTSEGCAGLEVSFMENTTNANSFIWDFGDGSPVVNEPNVNYVFPDPGSYTISLTAVGVGGCSSTTASTVVTISDSSTADFGSVPNVNVAIPLPDAKVTFEDLSLNGINWLWDFGDGTSSTLQNPDHKYDEKGEYQVTLTVTDNKGCVSRVTYGNYLVVEPDLFIPNVFSPNDDGINDVFEVLYTGSQSFNLQVFDRWGREYFAADAPTKVWDGNAESGSQAPTGVYYYTLTIGDKAYTGNLTLMR